MASASFLFYSIDANATNNNSGTENAETNTEGLK